MKLEVGAKSDLGQRKQTNEDNYAIYLPGDSGLPNLIDGGLLVVADGLGGHFAGEVASKLAVTMMKDFLTMERQQTDTPAKLLAETAQKANVQIHNANLGLKGFYRPMGTTLTAVFVEGDKAHFCHVGDSRAYLLRNGQVQLVTTDHSWVDEQVKMGLMTPEDARRDPRRNVLTRTLGTRPETNVDTFEKELRPEDMLVLCSDGLTSVVTDVEILKTCTDAATPQDAADKLISIANERGAPDNVTAVVAFVESRKRRASAKQRKQALKQVVQTVLRVVALLVALLVAFALGYYVGQLQVNQTVQTESPDPQAQSVQ
jgi:protein phosphatase